MAPPTIRPTTGVHSAVGTTMAGDASANYDEFETWRSSFSNLIHLRDGWALLERFSLNSLTTVAAINLVPRIASRFGKGSLASLGAQAAFCALSSSALTFYAYGKSSQEDRDNTNWLNEFGVRFVYSLTGSLLGMGFTGYGLKTLGVNATTAVAKRVAAGLALEIVSTPVQAGVAAGIVHPALKFFGMEQSNMTFLQRLTMEGAEQLLGTGMSQVNHGMIRGVTRAPHIIKTIKENNRSDPPHLGGAVALTSGMGIARVPGSWGWLKDPKKLGMVLMAAMEPPEMGGGVGLLKAGAKTNRHLANPGDSTPRDTKIELDHLGDVAKGRSLYITGTTDRVRFLAYTDVGLPEQIVLNPAQIRKNLNGDCVLVWVDKEGNTWMGVADGVSSSTRGDEAAREALESAYQRSTERFSTTPFDAVIAAQEKLEQIAVGFNSGTTTLKIIKLTPQNQMDYAFVGDGRFILNRAGVDLLEEIFPENPQIHRFYGEKGAPGQLGVKEAVLIPVREHEAYPLSETTDVAVRTGRISLDLGDQWFLTTDGLPGAIEQGKGLQAFAPQRGASLENWGKTLIARGEQIQDALFDWFAKSQKPKMIKMEGVGWIEYARNRWRIFTSRTGGSETGMIIPDNLGVVFGEVTAPPKLLPPPPRKPPVTSFDNDFDDPWKW